MVKQMNKDITFRVNHNIRRFDAIETNLGLRTFFNALLYNAGNISLDKIWDTMSVIESLIDKVLEQEEELKELKSDISRGEE